MTTQWKHLPNVDYLEALNEFHALWTCQHYRTELMNFRFANMAIGHWPCILITKIFVQRTFITYGGEGKMVNTNLWIYLRIYLRDHKQIVEIWKRDNFPTFGLKPIKMFRIEKSFLWCIVQSVRTRYRWRQSKCTDVWIWMFASSKTANSIRIHTDNSKWSLTIFIWRLLFFSFSFFNYGTQHFTIYQLFALPWMPETISAFDNCKFAAYSHVLLFFYIYLALLRPCKLF